MSRNGALLVLLLVLAASPVAGQRRAVVAANGASQSRLLEIHASDTSVVDLLARACAAFGVELRVEPALMADLVQRTISIDRARITLDELAILISASTGFIVDVKENRLQVRPAASDPETALADAAMHHLDHTILVHAEPRLAADVRYARADLLYRLTRMHEAGVSFESFTSEFPKDSRVPMARLLAGYAYYKSGDLPAAKKAIDQLEASDAGLPDLANAELVPAVIHRAAGDDEAAGIRLRRVVREGSSPRARAVASLLLTELELDSKRVDDAFVALAEFRSEARREFPDLAKHVPLAVGIGLMLKGDFRSALLQLRIAQRNVDEKSAQIRAAESVAVAFVALDDLVTGLVAVQRCLALGPEGLQKRRALLMKAELEERLGLFEQAVVSATETLAATPDASQTAERALAVLARSLGNTDRHDEAARALEALTTVPRYRAAALVHLARTERRAGNKSAALAAIDRLKAADFIDPTPSKAEVTTLRGELLLELGRPLEAARVFEGREEEKR